MLIGGRRRRPLVCMSFLRTSATPHGGATIALPFHGIQDVQFMNLVATDPLPFHNSMYARDFMSPPMRFIGMASVYP